MLTPADMDTHSITPLNHDDVVRILSDVTIGDLYAAESPFDVLASVGMPILHPFTTMQDDAIIRFAFVGVVEWGWIAVSFGPSLRKARDRDKQATWETSTDRFGLLAKSLSKPLVGVSADITGVLMRMADRGNDKSVYNSGYWSPALHHLMLTMQHLKQVSPEEFAATQTLIGLAHPHALVMMDRLGVWLANDIPEHRSRAQDMLETVAIHTWPSFVMDSEVLTEDDIVEHFIASMPHTEWTDVSVQQYLRSESRIQESPVRRTLMSEFDRHGDFLPDFGNDTTDRKNINLDNYDFFLHPERRQELNTTVEDVEGLEARYRVG